jgi:hypothetical protein
MSYKKYLDELQDKIAAYEYFRDDNLRHLQGSFQLSTVKNELFERAIKFKNTDKYEELIGFVDRLESANQNYDTMYSRYLQYKQGFEEMRTYANNLLKVVRKYEQEDGELLSREL